MKGFEFPDVSDSEKKIIKEPEEEIIPEQEITTYDNVDEYEDDTEIQVVNTNPYEEAKENINPYSNVNIEEVVENPKSPTPVASSPKPEQKTNPEMPNVKKKVLTDDEQTDLEIARIKAERQLKMKNIRTVFVIFMLVVLFTLAATYKSLNNDHSKKDIGDINFKTTKKEDEPIEDLEISAELNNFYQTGEKANVEKMLVDSAEDPGKVMQINNTALMQIDRIINDNIENSKDYFDYDQKMNTLLKYVESLNNIRFNDIAVLKDTDYVATKEKIDNIKNSSSEYFNGLNYYNAKDYNNAYTTFNNIASDNYFYKFAYDKKTIISDDIIKLLNNDIANLSTNLEYLDEAEKKVKYQQIKSIIEQYAKAYPYLHLETNQTYNDLLQRYTELSK